MKLAAAAQATSRTFLAVKCQVSVGLGPAGREDGCPTSAFVMIATVVSDRTARERRARWPAVRSGERRVGEEGETQWSTQARVEKNLSKNTRMCRRKIG